MATARAEQDTEGAEALDHAERPGRIDRLRQRMTGSVTLPDAGPDTRPDGPDDRAGDVGGTA